MSLFRKEKVLKPIQPHGRELGRRSEGVDLSLKSSGVLGRGWRPLGRDVGQHQLEHIERETIVGRLQKDPLCHPAAYSAEKLYVP